MIKKLALSSIVALSASAQAAQWFEEMQFGPAWSNTFEDTFNGQKRTGALKGILMDLGEHKHHALFDTETLRWVSAYEGFINWGGTPWTGAHGQLMSLKNEKPVFSTDTTCGWAAENGSFDDVRPLKGFGNLPKTHGRYLGYYKNGQAIVVEQEVLGAVVLESPELPPIICLLL